MGSRPVSRGMFRWRHRALQVGRQIVDSTIARSVWEETKKDKFAVPLLGKANIGMNCMKTIVTVLVIVNLTPLDTTAADYEEVTIPMRDGVKPDIPAEETP